MNAISTFSINLSALSASNFFYKQIQIAEISTWIIFLENLFSSYGFEKMKNDIMNT